MVSFVMLVLIFYFLGLFSTIFCFHKSASRLLECAIEYDLWTMVCGVHLLNSFGCGVLGFFYIEFLVWLRVVYIYGVCARVVGV